MRQDDRGSVVVYVEALGTCEPSPAHEVVTRDLLLRRVLLVALTGGHSMVSASLNWASLEPSCHHTAISALMLSHCDAISALTPVQSLAISDL